MIWNEGLRTHYDGGVINRLLLCHLYTHYAMVGFRELFVRYSSTSPEDNTNR